MSDLQGLRNPGFPFLDVFLDPCSFTAGLMMFRRAEKAVNDILKEEKRENVFV
jgi:hypothetical protein